MSFEEFQSIAAESAASLVKSPVTIKLFAVADIQPILTQHNRTQAAQAALSVETFHQSTTSKSVTGSIGTGSAVSLSASAFPIKTDAIFTNQGVHFGDVHDAVDNEPQLLLQHQSYVLTKCLLKTMESHSALLMPHLFQSIHITTNDQKLVLLSVNNVNFNSAKYKPRHLIVDWKVGRSKTQLMRDALAVVGGAYLMFVVNRWLFA